ncbi:nesprin-1 isoform X2 [Strongylocentrotus purpuratus]|uniref:KASH domain-containing protein n=1 Tax=Strongylocentrotus purpuratus TaxID=7668 RepID=A0A7M7PRB6_STRPU|nr:nesprin-1 isoform X2 [Strongylocentrotus purpuratus]
MLSSPITPKRRTLVPLGNKLEEELSAHQVLVKSVARRGAKRRSPSDNNEESKGIPLDLETDHELAEHRSKWEEISRQVAEKNRQLNASLEYIRPQDTPFVHHLPARRNLQLDVLNHDGKQEEDLKTSLDALNQCWAKMETQVSDQQSRLEQAYEFQTCYQDALQAVSGWLDGVQLKLFSEDWSKDTETQLKEHAALQEELKAFQDQLVHMNEACHLVQAETGARSKQLMQQSLDDVNQRLTTLETEARQREQQLVEKNRQFQGFQRDLQSFQLWLTGAKEQLNIPPINVSGASIEDNININKEERLKFQVLESEASRREMKYKDLVQKGEDLLALDPHLPAIAHDIATLQINWEELQRLLGNRRNQLNTAKILQEQYHKILKDYMEFLETAEKKLQNKTLSATDVDDLHHQLQKHKEFFSDLDTHHILIESIAQKADPFTQQLFHAQRSELDRRSQAIMAQATERGQTLEALVSDWRDLQASLRELSSWLGHVEAQVPSGINDATQDNVQKAIHKYQAMEGLLEGRQSSLRQVDSGAQALLRNLTSPQLEKQLALLRDQWSSVNQRVRHDLSSWTALLKEWRMFEQESIELIPWLRHVTDHMASLKDKDHTQKPISEQLEEFSKLQKDIEIHTPQKVSTCTHGNHLLKLKQLNTSPIREKLSSIESHWTDIQNELPQLQEDLHQSQMELLPSRQALNELMLWMDSLESALDSYNHKVYISSGDVKDTLQVYKGYKVDLSCHLLTVEFVNQSILQMSQDIESRRGDKTDFAEKLGTMNQRWQALNGRVGEETKVLELLLQRWKSFSKQVSDTNNTLKEQEDKVKLFDGPIGREASVKEALRICQAIEEHIKSKSSDLHQLKATAHSLTSDQESIKQTLQPLVNRQSALQRLVKHLKADQVTALEQWSLYQETLTVVQQALCKAEYALSRGNVIMGTVESLQVQTTKLREVQAELKSSISQLNTLCKLGDRLQKTCIPEISEDLDKTVQNLSSRWSKAEDELRSNINLFEKAMLLWQQFEDKHSENEQFLEDKETLSKLCIQGAREDEKVLVGMEKVEGATEEEMEQERINRCKKCQEILVDVDAYPVAAGLGSLVSQLIRYMDSSTSSNITSRTKVLQQRLDTLQQSLQRHIKAEEIDIQNQKQFREKTKSLLDWLEEVKDTLNIEEPNRSSDEHTIKDRMDRLKLLLVDFTENQPHVNALNEIGYRISLDRHNSGHLATLNDWWNKLYTRLSEKYRNLQGVLLQQQNFAQKCKSWMKFLADTEQSLAVDIAGSYDELLDQQKVYELFEADIFNRQQILFSIISDGQRMIHDGEVDDPDEFHTKLAQLSDQWQSVIRRASQRKEIIDRNIRDWQSYRTSLAKMNEWFRDMEAEVTGYRITTAPLQALRGLHEQTKMTQKLVSVQEGSYLSLNEAGKSLLRNSDRMAGDDLRNQLMEIQNRWHWLTSRLRKQDNKLTEILGRWEEGESIIDDLQAWLRGAHSMLDKPLPTQYEELQRELQRCKETENGFGNTKGKLEILYQRESQLCPSVSPDDMSVLHERIILLTKQLDEVHHQVCQRKQRITDKLNEWIAFTERYKEFSDWLTEMEMKVSQNGENSIEDLLQRLQGEYQDEIQQAYPNKKHLEGVGARLIPASNEARASDIEYKLAKLNDRWMRLMELVEARVKKLKDTLTAVQQLEQDMSNLREWLSRVERELNTPLTYETCHMLEIETKQKFHEELHKDITRHSSGVASVLNLCEVLLHDQDACSTDADCEAIRTATQTLDQRWHNICTLSAERKMRIEETWRLWQKFKEDYERFADWLEKSEQAIAAPNTSCTPYIIIKEEIKKYEAFQRKVHENLAQLEMLNKQYRRLAREGRTDGANQLRGLVHTANDRWDALARRCCSVLRRLRSQQGLRDEFEGTRESMVVWLTEMDLQLTNIEHFSQSDISTKTKQMKAFQHEIELNQSRLDEIDGYARNLMQRCDANDAAQIQEEMDDLRGYADEVFARVSKFQRKLERITATEGDSSAIPFDYFMVGNTKFSSTDSSDEEDNEGEPMSESDNDEILPTHLSPSRVHRRPYDARARSRGSSATRSASPGPSEYVSGRITPASGVSSLDWDEYMTTNADGEPDVRWGKNKHRGGEPIDVLYAQQLIDSCTSQLEEAENMVTCKTPIGPDVDKIKTAFETVAENCKSCIAAVKKMAPQLNDHPVLARQVSGLVGRWEVLQGELMEKGAILRHNYQTWQQYDNDLNNLTMWLDQAETTLSSQDNSGDIGDLEGIIRMYTDFMLGLSARRTIAYSVNLCSQQFVDPDTPQGQELSYRLQVMNRRWEGVCAKAADWQKKLQMAIVQCEEFHQTTKDLESRLNEIETIMTENEPIDFNADPEILNNQYRIFASFRQELEEMIPRMSSLKDTADQLLIDVDSPDCRATRETLHLIAKKSSSLLQKCNDNLELLETKVDPSQFQLDRGVYESPIQPRSVMLLGAMGEVSSDFTSPIPGRSSTPIYSIRHYADATTNTLAGRQAAAAAAVAAAAERSPDTAGAPVLTGQGGRAFLSRAVRAALPLHLLMLLLLGVACFIPMTEEDYSCTLTNNFARSLHPMLRYTNGPPPI